MTTASPRDTVARLLRWLPERLGVASDVLGGSAERRAQAVLRETRQFYIAIDEQQRVLAWNRSAERLFGFSAAEVEGRVLDDLIIPPVHHAAHSAGVEHFRRTGHGRGIDGPVEVMAVRADGSPVPVELSIWAERTRRGFVFHALGTDLSERRRHEDVLRLLASSRQGLLHSASPDETRQGLCDTVHRLTGCAQVLLYVPETHASALGPAPDEHDQPDAGEPEVLQLVACSGAGAPTSGTLPVTPQLQCALSGSGAWAAELDGSGLQSLRAHGLASAAVQSVRRHGRLLGVLVLGWTTPGAAAAPVDRQLLELLATEAAEVAERLLLQRRLEAAAMTDPLTGLPNRRALWQTLAREVDRSCRKGTPVTLAMLDLDRFKAYNDRLGHPAGDALLVRTAQAWSGLVRHVDLLARLGGDEFALLLPDTDAETAAQGLRRIVDATPAEVGVTTGLAQLDAGETAQQLVERADADLYRRKRGRGA